MAMRWGAAVGLVIATGVVAGLQAQDPAPQPQQPPVFRADVDLIELDVSVLDSNRRPVRGLTLQDFSVTEDGRPQRVVAVSHVDLAEHDPARSARMRYVPRDVSANDLADQLGDGRLVAIVFDDVNLPADDPDIVRMARETARHIVDQLGPSDMAAVVYSHNAGRTQDFTDDREKLLDAIDRFQPAALDWIGQTPRGMGPSNGDILQSWSPTLARSACMRGEPAVPTLDTVASRLATAPGRRKALMFISVGVPMSMTGGDACGSQLADVMKGVFRKAQRANVNIYAIDPGGLNGYRDYVRFRAAARGAESTMPGRRRVPRNIRALQDFMRVMADNTGGRAVINTDAIEPAIDQIFNEDRVYYLLGYETTNGAPDGKFREVTVRVNRPGVSVRSRSGYWAPLEGEVVDRRLTGGPSAENAALSGLTQGQTVALRVALAPVARAVTAAGPVNRQVDVAAILSVRFPPIRAGVADTLTVTRNVYDADGRAGPPVRFVESVQLQPGGGDEARHDLLQRLTLAPGRYQVRFHVQSALLRASGTVFADLDVPDFSRSPLALSGLAITSSVAGTARSDALGDLMPIVPTSARDFTRGETLTGFVQIYQASGPPSAVTIATEVLDAADLVQHQASTSLTPEDFDASGGSAHQFQVPLAGLAPGPHLLSVTARLPGGRTARRDLVFRVR
jgi:VWFA-related protein